MIVCYCSILKSHEKLVEKFYKKATDWYIVYRYYMNDVMFFRYEAGDHVAVYPVNDRESVERIGKRLNVDLDTVFTLTNVDGKLCTD